MAKIVKLNDQQSVILAAFIEAAAATGKFSGTVVTALSDGKLSGLEGLEIVVQAPAVVSAVKPVLKSLREWQYMEESNKKQVVDAFGQNFDIPSDKAEEVIETVVSSAVTIQSAVDKVVKAVKKMHKLPAVVKTGVVSVETEKAA